MLVLDREIAHITSTRNLKLGREYCNNNFVTQIDITYDEKNEVYIIEGVIENGAYENQCKVLIDTDNTIITYGCNCYWCNEDSACGHIAAMLFKVQSLSPDDFPYHYCSSERNEYLERLKVMQEKQRLFELNNQMNISKGLIDYYKDCKSNEFKSIFTTGKYDILMNINKSIGGYHLKFKVGNEKKYLIKNINEFLMNIDNNTYHSYGKNLGFIHSTNAFSDDALKIIDLMRRGMNEYESVERRHGNYRLASINYIPISSSLCEKLFDTITSLENSNGHVKVLIKHEPVVFEVKKEDDFYNIELQDISNEKFYSYKNIYDFDEDMIIQYKLDDLGKTMKFIDSCDSNKGYCVSNDDIGDFYKYVLGDLKDYISLVGDEISITSIDKEVLTLYGDINELEQISFYLESKRDNEVIYSFDHQGKDTSVNFDLIEDHLLNMSDVIDYENHCMYMNLENEKAYTFLNEGLPYLAKYCDILVSDTLQKLGKKNQYTISVGVTLENDLLSIDVESIDIPSEELASVLNSYQKKKKFHRLKNGHLLYLESDELEELDEFMNDYNIKPKMLEDGHMDMSVYRAFSIDDKANNSKYLDFNRSDIFSNTISKLKDINASNFELSSHYQGILRDYQKFGYKWLQAISSYGFGGILADDMGLGKTLQVIALLDENKASDKTSIVICPSSLLLNWQDEIHKFSNDLTCTCVHGSLAKRKIAIKSFNDVDVLITTYDYMRRDSRLYDNYTFEYIILDEAQYIKNPKTKNAAAVKMLKGNHRFALTGTPIENSLAELWSIFDFLMPDYLFNYHYFQGQYETPIVKNQDVNKQENLKKLITPFILRRNKKDVLLELPEKIEKTLLLEFNAEEEKLYLANLVQVNKELQEQLHYESVDRIIILAMLTKLRQICCEPRTIYENITNISSKLEGCLDLIRSFKENNQKVLLFSSFTSVLDLISEELSKEGISYYQLTGSTKKEERHRLVNEFQKDDTTVFLISLKAGGTGLNLTAAQAVIHFDPWWNMSAQNQATDRAHRIGQENVVTVYKLVMKDSIEEKILELQNKKKNLADSFVENNEGSITSMSTNDIIELFSMN